MSLSYAVSAFKFRTWNSSRSTLLKLGRYDAYRERADRFITPYPRNSEIATN
jgi:hypothetical protein